MLLYNQHSTPNTDCQGFERVLTDKSSTGRERPWREKKQANELLSAIYEDVNTRKAERLAECGDLLTFSIKDGTRKLKHMNSCRVRLCPLCAWRRSLKVHSHTVRILDAMDGDYAYIFLTLTVRNCEGEELSKELDRLMGAWQRLTQRKAVRGVVKGWYRGLEVTHNINPESASYDTYHPHFHCLLAVRKGYFTSKEYLSKAAWAQLWQQALGVDYEPVVDVRRVKGTTSAAVAEAAKYTVKDADYIIPQDLDLSVETVRILDDALDKRRLVAYGGLMKEWHQQLNLDDEVDGDLVNVGEEETAAAVTDREVIYAWHTGYSQYIRKD